MSNSDFNISLSLVCCLQSSAARLACICSHRDGRLWHMCPSCCQSCWQSAHYIMPRQPIIRLVHPRLQPNPRLCQRHPLHAGSGLPSVRALLSFVLHALAHVFVHLLFISFIHLFALSFNHSLIHSLSVFHFLIHICTKFLFAHSFT